MSAAFDHFTNERGRCSKCKCDSEVNDLTQLGHMDLCCKCYREAIADLQLRRSDYEGQQSNSSAWEE